MQQMRLARHVSDIPTTVTFYQKLGFKVIGSFENHSKYDGVFLSLNDSYHLEFTSSDELPNRLADPDDLMVLYCSDHKEYERLNDLFETQVLTRNPYWHDKGITIRDPDGQVIVICKEKW